MSELQTGSKEIKSVIYTKTFRICSSEFNFSIAIYRQICRYICRQIFLLNDL